MTLRGLSQHICCVSKPSSSAGRASIAPLERAGEELAKASPPPRDAPQEVLDRYRRAVARVVRETGELVQGTPGAPPIGWARYASARRAFSSDAELARALDVHRSQISRWKRGEPPEPLNEERLRDLDVVVSLLSGFLDESAIPDWLHGFNAHLGNRRPIDVLRTGRLSEVVAAIEAERSGAYA